MRVLVLASTYPLGAGDTTPAFVHELCKRLVARGHEVTVSTPHVPGAALVQELDGVRVKRYRYCLQAFEQLVGQGGIVSRLRERPWRTALVPLLLLAMSDAVLRETKRQRYDLVHAHWLIPQGLVAALLRPMLRNAPLVCTAHGGDLFALNGARFGWLRRLIVTRASIVTLVSRHMRDVLAGEGVPDAKLEVASMGVDLIHQFVPVPGVKRDSSRVVFVGRLVEKKGVRHLLEAWQLVLRRHPEAHLTIVGDGPERSALEALARTLSLGAHLEFLGARPPAELPKLYSRAAIAVVPSIIDRSGDQEGLGLVTVEAIGCGCAVVVSDLEAIRDVVTDGCTGLVTRAADATSLAAAIVRLLDEPALRAQLAANARTEAVEKFDWQAVTGRYERLYAMAATRR